MSRPEKEFVGINYDEMDEEEDDEEAIGAFAYE